MKTNIRTLYADEAGEYGLGLSDYWPLLVSMGYEILVKVDDRDYQGDSRVLVWGAKGYGVLIFGWGSCSGCDALQACHEWEQVEKLRAELMAKVVWYGNRDKAAKAIAEKDWEVEFCDKQSNERFVRACLAVLGASQ